MFGMFRNSMEASMEQNDLGRRVRKLEGLLDPAGAVSKGSWAGNSF